MDKRLLWHILCFLLVKIDALVKSLISDGAVKSSRSRLAQFLKNAAYISRT